MKTSLCPTSNKIPRNWMVSNIWLPSLQPLSLENLSSPALSLQNPPFPRRPCVPGTGRDNSQSVSWINPLSYCPSVQPRRSSLHGQISERRTADSPGSGTKRHQTSLADHLMCQKPGISRRALSPHWMPSCKAPSIISETDRGFKAVVLGPW